MPPVGYRKNVKAALPGTYDEIAAKACVSRHTVKRWLKMLREDGECHIKKWQRSGGDYQPVWVAGPGKDAKCTLKRLTNAQRCKRFVLRHRDDETGDKMRQRVSVRHFTRKAATVGDPLVLAVCRPVRQEVAA